MLVTSHYSANFRQTKLKFSEELARNANQKFEIATRADFKFTHFKT